MRKKAFLLMVFFPALIFSQEKKFEFSATIGNNGQLDKTLNDFYFWGHETYYLDDSKVGETSNLKYSVSARYFFTETISTRVKFGQATRSDHYTRLNEVDRVEYNFKQNVFNVSPSICFSKSIDNFEIMTGIELPIVFIGDFLFEEHFQVAPDSVNITIDQTVDFTMDGGLVWGINNFIGVKYFFTDWFGIGTELNYGILFANMGKKVKMDIETTLPESSTTTYEYDKKYNKTFFSTPEVSLGVIFRI